MNNGLFRLVFSRHLNMFVPASEAARSHGHQSSGKRLRSKQRALLTVLASAASIMPAYADGPAGLVPDGSSAWVNAQINAALTNATQMTITQLQAKAIVNWQQFTLNRGETLNIQDQATWSMLHRIGGLDPSVINGMINAKGHQYFYNANGIIFGGDAQINVGSLTATSLNITNKLFLEGLNSGSNPLDPNFEGSATSNGFVRVDAGAHITTASGGRVMLLAENVENKGVISTPDGQTILAAGKKIYLTDSTDPAGLLVEVEAGGTATNVGDIVAQRGNVTLVGLAVNQDGRINATTSVRANGSIHLLAKEKTTSTTATYGNVTLGANSVTQVSTELTDKEEVLDSQAFNKSNIKIEGNAINVSGTIRAKGGDISLNGLGNDNRIYLDTSALIDASGEDATAPMSRNQLEIQLFSDQLKDTPILRNTSLFGTTVYVDARKGTPITDIAPFLALKGRTVAEKLSEGGTVNLNATGGDVIVRDGAKVDVSGGSISYDGGFIKETSLQYNGQLTPISQANKDTPYQGTGEQYIVTDSKWGVTRSWTMSGSPSGVYSPGYMAGSDAGTVTLNGANAVLDGAFVGNTKVGQYQRNDAPDGATLALTVGSAVNVTQQAQKLVSTFSATDALDSEHQNETEIDTSLLQHGFNHLSINADGTTVNAKINTQANGSVSIVGGSQINADISVASGDITLRGNTTLADGVIISSSGLWTNDSPGLTNAMTAPVATDAGNITTDNLLMGENSLLQANAGAWLSANGQLTKGKAGNISVQDLLGDLDFQAYGFDKGGSFTVRTNQDIQIGGLNPDIANTLWLGESFFERGGFSAYNLKTISNDASIVIGDSTGKATTIAPVMHTLQLQNATTDKTSGANILDVAQPILTIATVRKPVSLTFSAFNTGDQFGSLTLLENTTIKLDTPNTASDKGSVTLEAGGNLNILGSIIAPSSDINIKLSGGPNNFAYDHTDGIYIGEHAKLIATGTYVAPANTADTLQNAKVLDAGNIAITAAKGAVVAKASSIIDVSGTSGKVDVRTANGFSRETLNSDAGKITVSARDGLALDGDFLGKASGTATGGSLSVALTGNASQPSDINQFPSDGREFTVTQAKQLTGAAINAGDALDSLTGKAQISVAQINNGGFDRVSIASGLGDRASYSSGQDKIILQSGTNLNTVTSIDLTAPVIEVSGNGEATVSSAYVGLNSNSGETASSNAIALTQGSATFTVNADLIDLNGKLAINNVGTTNLNSNLDIRARGNQAGTTFTRTTGGWLTTTGQLNLTARQIYPVTNTVFRFDAQGTNSQINIASNGQDAKPILSAGGILMLKADEINQGGVLRAPLGQIALEAANKITLENKSLTSVSADGLLIPYGMTKLGGLEWYLTTSDFQSGNLTKAPLDKKINIKAPEVNMQSGSTLDISGSGDTLAYEWVEGIGGSKDILAQPGVYAVIPSMKGEYAAFDYNDSLSSSGEVRSDLSAGDAVYLSGVPGLPAGIYTLLPGRYALLPGAYMVQTSTTSLTQGKQVQQLDGSTLTSGYRTTVSDSSRDADWSTFKVTSGSVFRPAKGTVSQAPAEYLLSLGSQFFNDKAVDSGLTVARLAADAGQLVFDASQKLVLEGMLKTSKSAGARGALVDIVADNIKVVSTVGPADGSLQLSAESLDNLQAESLLLGGTRTQTDAGFSIATGASTVTFANDASHSLAVTELFATATDRVTMLAGSTISTLPTTQTKGNTSIGANGDGALLAVSGINDISYDRSGVSASPTQGTLDIQSGANITAGRSLVLDATKAATLKGDLDVVAGGSATLGANRVLLGDSGSEIGLQLDNDVLSSLGDLSKITLNSYQNVDIYGPVSFGNQNIDITINAGGLAGHMGAGEAASLVANNFTLKNSTGATFTSSTSASGSAVNINATNVVFEGKNPALSGLSVNAGKTAVAGFEQVNINANKEVRFSGTGEANIQASTTNINSTRITADSRTDYKLSTAGDLITNRLAQPETLAASADLGAKLNLVASSMTLGGDITLASGKLVAQTTTSDLNIASDANISVASIPVTFDKLTENTPGGSIDLQADLANVNVANTATLDVSGANDANAGAITVTAKNGSANILGNLNGEAGTGKQSGSFTLDVRTLNDFSALNTVLNNGSFNAMRDMRVRSGDVAVAASDVVNARNFTLSTDTGSIAVSGTVNAKAESGGAINLNAAQNLTLNNGALLDASATKPGEAGGNITLASKAGVLDLKAGSQIDVSGGAGANGGDVLLRTSRTGAGSGNGVAVTALDTTITGADSTILEAVRVFNLTGANSTLTTGTASTTSSLGYTTIANDVTSFMANKATILSALGKAGDSTFHLQAGTEVRATGNLTVSSDWNLYSASRAGNEPGTLTLRAANNLAINGSISDGFTGALATDALGLGQSWSYRLVAGADTSAANVMATSKDAGSFTLANAKLIRTGTGDIDIASGGNITMGNESSVIYTAGNAANTVTGFTGQSTARYLTNGGDLSIIAQGDIVGKVASGTAQQLINHWLFRQGGGTGNKDVSWWVRPDLFKQGVAAFGGGDIAIKAGGNISNFSASIPTTGRYVYEKVNGTVNYNNLLASEVDGGGQLSVIAGRDIQSGIYYVGRGDIDINAGNEVTAASNNMGTVIALQDASANVSAVNGTFIEAVFNPTLWAQSSTNISSGVANATGDSSFFNTYGADSKLNLSAITGDARLGLYQASNIENRTRTGLASFSNSQQALSFNPSSVTALAFDGNINVGDLILTPSQSGNLKLLATGNIAADRIAMSDADAKLLPTVSAPLAGGTSIGNPVSIYAAVATSHSQIPVHGGDDSSVYIVARDGDMIGRSNTNGLGILDIVLPKSAYIRAGNDIKNLNANLQHLNSSDTTVISAGHDLILQTPAESIALAGPGNLLVKAGRNIDLGSSAGIQTTANTLNAALSSTGASITLAAGLGKQGANVADYIATYIAPNGTGPIVLQGDSSKLAQYRADTAKAVTDYMKQTTGDASLSDADAMTQYLALDEDRQAIFAYRHFSSELLASGKSFAETQNHIRGDSAVEKLFANGGYDGDLLMYNSQVVTARDGSIDIVAPGGLINAGVPGASAANVGIVTEKGGAIRAFSDSGFLVNQSKVITQFGSDITVWVNNGDIDAGRGSKTALSVPERVVTTDVDGRTTIEFKGVAAGSGIRAQTYDPDGTDGPQTAPLLGSVALIAPRGVLNAGEAGVAAGNFLAVATQVIGANNISVSGTSTGVPVADTGSLAGSLGGLSNVAADATKSATEDVARQLAQSSAQDFMKKNFLPSIISVEVIGLGDL